MGKTDRKYVVILLILTLIVVLVKVLQPTPVDWSESYSASEKKPFGTFILNELLVTDFKIPDIATNNQPIFESELGIDRTNWIFINQGFHLDEFETEILHEKVESGDIVFISARQLGGAFADSLNLRLRNSFPAIDPSTNSLDSLTTNALNFTNPQIKKNGGWPFPINLTESYFTSFDTVHTEILGFSDEDQPNYIRLHYGEGSYLIHSNPFLFTNYYMKDTGRYDYAFKALSYLPARTTIWDEYYKIGRLSFSSPLRYVVSNSNLKWAWFIALFGMIAFLILNGRRTQRIIPVIKAPVNSSIDFAQTIANLYLNNGTHADILKKKVLFLYEYIRTNLNVQTDDLNAKVLEDISSRSGIELEEIQQLFQLIDLLEGKEEITKNELKRITERIDRFYKQSQR